MRHVASLVVVACLFSSSAMAGTKASKNQEAQETGPSILDEWFPLWFQDDLHPQLEEKKWPIVGTMVALGCLSCGLLFPEFWVPMLFLDPKPPYEFGPLFTTYIRYAAVRIGMGIAEALVGNMVPGVGCLFGALMFIIGWSQIVATIQTWDQMLKKQDRAKGKDKDQD